MRKILKPLGIFLLLLVALVLVLGLIAPRKIATQRTIVIQAPPALVFNTLNDLRTWDSWSPWKEADPTIVTTMGEPHSGPGSYSTWVSENSGSGKMSILASQPGELVDVEVVFGDMGAAHTPLSLKPVDGGTEVTWVFVMPVGYPMNAMLLFSGSGAVEKDFERGLQLLKQKIENELSDAAQKKYNGYEVKVVELPERHYVAVRDRIPLDQVSAHFAKNLPRVYQALQARNIDAAGMPCGLFFAWDEAAGETDVAQAVPVANRVDVGGDFVKIMLLPTRALLVEYYGDYGGVEAAHTAIDQYLAATGGQFDFPVIEEYANDPKQEPDPDKWLTRVYYPLKK